jgi:hypothetical protein
MKAYLIVPALALFLANFNCSSGKPLSKDLRALSTNPKPAVVPPEVPGKVNDLVQKPVGTADAPKPKENPDNGATAEPAPTLTLSGDWKKACESDKDTGESALYILAFQGNLATNTQIQHSDLNCGSPVFTFQVTSTVKLGAASSKVSGAFELDHTNVRTQLMAATPEGATFLRDLVKNDPDCQNFEFNIGVPKDVTLCGLMPDTLFDLVKKDGDQLSVGDCSADGVCESKEQRATSLETKAYSMVK